MTELQFLFWNEGWVIYNNHINPEKGDEPGKRIYAGEKKNPRKKSRRELLAEEREWLKNGEH